MHVAIYFLRWAVDSKGLLTFYFILFLESCTMFFCFFGLFL